MSKQLNDLYNNKEIRAILDRRPDDEEAKSEREQLFQNSKLSWPEECYMNKPNG
jgi:hypothetical protein